MAADAHEHGSGHSHGHGVNADADRKWLTIALILIGGFMAIEVVIGIIAQSLALISDAGHMLTDAASIVLALIAIRLSSRPARGSYTFGLKRAEILSAQANGVTLFLLAAFFIYEGIRRLITPPEVSGLLVFITALAGIAVNVAATWCISKANRSSLNVEGAFQHILNDLYAFIATAVAGAVVWLTGFTRADAIAATCRGRADAQGGLGPGPRIGTDLLGSRACRPRPRHHRNPARGGARGGRGARSPHLADHLRPAGAVGPHIGGAQCGLPRNTA